MSNKHYASAYAAFFLIGVLAVAIPVFSTARLHVATIIVVLAFVFVMPVVAIWIMRRLGYPLGRKLHCPRCNTGLPAVRRPASFKQAMFGGWTCAQCGARLDARGR